MKKILRNRLFIFILGVIITLSVNVIAATYFPSNQVTYDNKTSGLSATEVQGAIDELYTICSTPQIVAADFILDSVNIVTRGDGLYKDNYEDGKYFYKGNNPNNYVTFNNEQAGWRILSIQADKTIKIIKNNAVTSSSYGNDYSWPNTSIKTYLNEDYYNNLTSEAKKQITTYYFNTYADTTFNNAYLSTWITTEKKSTWLGNIAIPNLSEYLRANSNLTCAQNIENNNKYICNESNWMATNTRYWLLCGYGAGSRFSQYVANEGKIYSDEINVYHSVRPTLYLSSKTKITGGSGTILDPYIIK